MKIYVSSTFEDLKEFRGAVYGQLRKLQIDAVAMEDYVAGEKRPLAKCLEDVAEADIYLGIVAWRYGYVPKEGNPECRSITELEYRAAGEHGKERLIFLLRDEAPWTPSLMDAYSREGDSGKLIERLREELRTRHAVGFFSTPDELAKEVSAAVVSALLHPHAEVQDRGDPAHQPIMRALPPGFSPARLSCLSWRAFKRGLEVASSIGRIEDIEGRGFATGFLVPGASLHPRFGGDLYLLTPAHIIVREKSQQSFGLMVDEATFRLTIPEEIEEVIRLSDLAWSSPIDELDLSVVRLERQPKHARGLLSVADTLPILTQGRPHKARLPHQSGQLEEIIDVNSGSVIVIGHPRGDELFFSLGGFLLDHNDTALQYVAATQPGSGGSPVLNSLWNVIGVHRLRGRIPSLRGQGEVEACQALSLPAIRRALRKEFG